MPQDVSIVRKGDRRPYPTGVVCRVPVPFLEPRVYRLTAGFFKVEFHGTIPSMKSAEHMSGPLAEHYTEGYTGHSASADQTPKHSCSCNSHWMGSA